MRVKVYLHSPIRVLAPALPPHIRSMLPDLEFPEGATIETLLQTIGVGKARPVVLINKVRQKDDVRLKEGDQVDLVLPIAGG